MKRLMLPLSVCAFSLITLLLSSSFAQTGSTSTIKIGKLKYQGGGDWYANPSSLKNLVRYARDQAHLNLELEEEVVEPGSNQIFQYPVLFATGHGNILFTDQEVRQLRKYLLAGGFLLIDDSYGMHKYALRELKRIFPEYSVQELPFSHPIFRQAYSFPNGLPKVHEHDGKATQALGLTIDGRLVCLLTFESDLSDGWEDQAVHNDSEDVRQKALKMGVNILQYLFMN